MSAAPYFLRISLWNQTGNLKSKKPRCCAAFEGLTKLERAKGFEPSTPTLARLCSTPELHPLALVCWLGLRYMAKAGVICNRKNAKSVIFLKDLRRTEKWLCHSNNMEKLGRKSKKPRCCVAFESLTKLERAKGFEPSTPTLARLCSTPELHPLAPVFWLGLRYMAKPQVICNREFAKTSISFVYNSISPEYRHFSHSWMV